MCLNESQQSILLYYQLKSNLCEPLTTTGMLNQKKLLGENNSRFNMSVLE